MVVQQRNVRWLKWFKNPATGKMVLFGKSALADKWEQEEHQNREQTNVKWDRLNMWPTFI